MTAPAPQWRRACVSGTCVQVARAGDTILVADSKEPDRVLRFTLAEWDDFAQAAEAGQFRFGS